MTNAQLQQHFRYSAWASERLLGAAAGLSAEELERDFQTADHSVVGTLAHVFAADRVWLWRVKGVPYTTFIEPEERRLPVLQKEWPAIYSGWQILLAGETDASVLRKVAYKDMKGNPYETPLWQIVLHVVNHGSHHRGQAAGMIRAMGHRPPPLDLIAYYRSLPPA